MVSFCMRRVASVTRAVTWGFPSRSPPIQDPKRRNGGTAMGSPGYAAAREDSISR